MFGTTSEVSNCSNNGNAKGDSILGGVVGNARRRFSDYELLK